MTECQIPDPATPPPPVSVESSPGEIPADPLLGSDSFIDPDVAIEAQPISMLRPGEDPVPAEKARGMRNMEERSVRPSWLPEDWKMSLKVRSSGSTAGVIDRYYIDPAGKRKFRSKNEVVHFLETGSKKKRLSTSGKASAPSEKSAKRTRTGKRVKKSTAANSGGAARPHSAPKGVNADASG